MNKIELKNNFNLPSIFEERHQAFLLLQFITLVDDFDFTSSIL